MKHIKTASAEEVQAKKEFAVVTSDEAIVADDKAEQAARKLYKLSKTADMIELEMSAWRAFIMSYMQGHPLMTSKDGTPLCSWKAGSALKKTDWAGLCKERGITDDEVDRFTSRSSGARRFSIEIE